MASSKSTPFRPQPAYLPQPGSILNIDQDFYTTIRHAPRISTYCHTLPPRSGHAFLLPAHHILRLSTPSGPQVCDLNLWSLHNPLERFWASRTRQLHSSHLTTFSRLWSTLPYLRPLATIIADSIIESATRGEREGTPESRHGYGGLDRDAKSRFGGRCHDLLGTRCDPYVNALLSGGEYDFHCHSNLVRAVVPWGLAERDVHDVLNVFQVTGLDERGRYFMEPSPAQPGDFFELFAEMDLLVAVSACPGGDLSKWGWGEGEEDRERNGMEECCRELGIEVFEIESKEVLKGREEVAEGWTRYKGLHGMRIPSGENK
ncbi:MAG: hypothetical protein M1820_005098 [Bogoriella megaspora]|nr:MAG: hypothetical protein M1820_005098 [Bogoriella megaspora]